jgi:hypothetical protein
LKQATFRDYVTVDDTTGAINEEETMAETDVY